MGEEEYEVLECLGKGQIADVYRGRVRATGEEVAVKVVDLGEAGEAGSDDFAPIVEEIATLARVDCPHLTRYRAAHVVRGGAALWIVAELMRAGSVADVMRALHGQTLALAGGVCARGGLRDCASAAHVLRGALRGLDFLHARGVPHAGVKCSNVLVDARGAVRLTDYGVFEQLQHQMTKRDTYMHSPYWLAPEIIAQGEEAPFSAAADVWALGITAIELATGRPPRFDEHPMKAIFNIPKGDPPALPPDVAERFGPSYADFVALCLQKDPARRPTSAQLLQHPLIAATCAGEAEAEAEEEVPPAFLEAVEASINARAANQQEPSAAAPAETQNPAPDAAAAAAAAAAAPATTTTTTATSPPPQQRATPLTVVIYPALSRLLAENKESEPTVMALAKLKIAFDALERTKPGSVHAFIGHSIEALGAQQQQHQKK